MMSSSDLRGLVLLALQCLLYPAQAVTCVLNPQPSYEAVASQAACIPEWLQPRQLALSKPGRQSRIRLDRNSPDRPTGCQRRELGGFGDGEGV
ncbi:uncharacterized protein IWZ02DRAFT_456817 [Phyllosticta citriasiana]|uniref:uncharacterized protein n=1 Tax=Phyllosticta citriasiana TaxID=595635 RepID=UPI0030FD862C